MSKSALITGVNGQDGGHLAEFLGGQGYEVFGMIRGQMEAGHPKAQAFSREFPNVNLIFADLTDQASLVRAVQEAKPDEVYNLGAISHVGYSFKNPDLTHQVTGGGVLKMLEAIRLTGRENSTRFYQASTSEMYGGQDHNRPDTGYTEDSPFHPRSPYGAAKLYGHWITRNYRESYGMHASNGILFNHEGTRRGPEFVTRKITTAAARYVHGDVSPVAFGNLDAVRDWGYAGDYVKGMWLMLQQETPDDYVLASGEAHTVREFIELAFKEVEVNLEWRGEGVDEVGIDPVTNAKVITINPKFYRPAEVDFLLGDPTKAEKVLGWKREVSFEGLVKMMVSKDLTLLATAA